MHLDDLRAEVGDLEGAEREAWLERVREDWRTAELSAVDRALCAYADKLTSTPGAMRESDVEALRALGVADETIHEAIQVIAFFNYINRVADAVHVDPEPGMAPYPADAEPT